MNIIATIPKREDKRWMRALFSNEKKARIVGDRIADYPPMFPFARKISQEMKGRTLYVVYNGYIVGYGRIKKHHYQDRIAYVGVRAEAVGPGTRLTLEDQLLPVRPPIPCVGFRNFRYTSKEFETLSLKEAQEELRKLRLKSPNLNQTRKRAGDALLSYLLNEEGS